MLRSHNSAAINKTSPEQHQCFPREARWRWRQAERGKGKGNEGNHKGGDRKRTLRATRSSKACVN